VPRKCLRIRGLPLNPAPSGWRQNLAPYGDAAKSVGGIYRQEHWRRCRGTHARRSARRADRYGTISKACPRTPLTSVSANDLILVRSSEFTSGPVGFTCACSADNGGREVATTFRCLRIIVGTTRAARSEAPVQAAGCAWESCGAAASTGGVSAPGPAAPDGSRRALEDIAQIHERIDLQVLTSLHEGTQDGGSMRRRFAPRKQPVFAAKHDRSERLLCAAPL